MGVLVLWRPRNSMVHSNTSGSSTNSTTSTTSSFDYFDYYATHFDLSSTTDFSTNTSCHSETHV